MNLKASKTGLGVMAAIGVVVGLVACGSDPKPDPNTAPTATPSATAPATPDTAAPTASVTAAAPAVDAGPPVDPKVAECEGYRTDAGESLDAKRIEVDKDCKKDADCAPIKGRACGFECVTGAIPKSLTKNWDTAVTKVKGEQCKKWDDNKCSTVVNKPAPTCKDQKVACDKGRCILKDK